MEIPGIGINSANVLHYERGIADTRSYVRKRRGAIQYPECELVAQGRARVVVSAQDISVEKRDRVCVPRACGTSDLDLLLNKIIR
jgi:hypothetical protein